MAAGVCRLPRARSAAFREALQQAAALPELHEGSAAALQRAEQVAEALPSSSLLPAAIHAAVAEQRSWLGEPHLTASGGNYARARTTLGQQTGADGRRDWAACVNAEAAQRTGLRWSGVSADAGVQIEADVERGGSDSAEVEALGLEWHALLLSVRRHRDADAAPVPWADMRQRAQRLLESLSVGGESFEALRGRALLTLGAALRVPDYLQAALVRYDSRPPSDARADAFTQVTALCENAGVVLWPEGQRSASSAVDADQSESLLTRALELGKRPPYADSSLSLMPLYHLAVFFDRARNDPITAEGLFRACLDKTSADAFAAPSEADVPAFSPAERQCLQRNAMLAYASLLQRVEWNGRRRTADAEAVHQQMRRQCLPPTADQRPVITPTWQIWHAHACRRLGDVTW